MFRQKNIEKYLNRLKLFKYSIKLEYDKLRGKNHHILILNPGFILNTDNNFEIIIKTILECTKLDYFRRIEFIDVFSPPATEEETRLHGYWVYETIRATKNKRVLQDTKNLVVFLF